MWAKRILGQMMFLSLVISCATNSKGVDSSGELSSGNIQFDAKKKVLGNGLTVILVENHKLPVFSYYTYYKVGSKHELPGITGASHFLEHMMFKGAKKYGPGEFDKFIEGNGGRNNAYTTNDLTVYYENLPSEHLNRTIDIEADRMENLTLGEMSFENERNVVLEERKMRYENRDGGKLYLNLMRNMFTETPYGTSVIGTIPDLKSVTRDQIYDYFKKFYAPNNAVIVISGDFNSSDVFAEIERKFGSIKSSPGLEDYKEEVTEKRKGFEFKGKYNRSVRLKGISKNPIFMLGYKGIKVGPRDAYVLDILSSILASGNSSYFHQNFVFNKSPILSNVYAGNNTMQESGVFIIGGTLLKGKSLNGFKKNLYKQVKRSCVNAIDERSVLKIKNQYFVDMLDGLNTNAGVASFLGDREVYYGDYLFYKEEMETYNSVTVEELQDACRKYLRKENSIFLSIWNKHPRNKG